MMEKQISKKKLERLTIHGGDYRRAGERSGANLTITKLRELLDDDVKNLKRMTNFNQLQNKKITEKGEKGEIESQISDISNEELDLIFDRQKIFPSFSCAPLTSASFSSTSTSRTTSSTTSFTTSSTTSPNSTSLTLSTTLTLSTSAQPLHTSSSSTSLSSATTVEGTDDEESDPRSMIPMIPLEGVMYDIITAQKGAGVLSF